MKLYGFYGKVKKSKYDSEMVYVIASSQESAEARIASFVENYKLVNKKPLQPGWNTYTEN
jgi:hypothetical protein